MANQSKLTGSVLLDCAKANAKDGLQVASQRCGYGDNTEKFLDAIRSTGSDMGIEINSLDDLITDQQSVRREGGVEIAPDSRSNL